MLILYRFFGLTDTTILNHDLDCNLSCLLNVRSRTKSPNPPLSWIPCYVICLLWEIIWLWRLLSELGFPQNDATRLNANNTSAIQIAALSFMKSKTYWSWLTLSKKPFMKTYLHSLICLQISRSPTCPLKPWWGIGNNSSQINCCGLICWEVPHPTSL